MSCLRIENLSIRTVTSDGLYGVDIPFFSGLNIIHAENTHGKSTIIQSIIFALGLEGCLGPSRKVPLKTALTSQLRKADGSKATIIESKIYLTISNGSELVTLMRSSSVDKKDLVSVFFNTNVEQAIKGDSSPHDYFLRFEGSAIRERGFHYFLSEFMGVSQPTVLKYNGAESPLYLESIFCINYVEQTRGWGGILNILPSYLGIKELPERIIEYTLDLDVQSVYKKKQELQQKKKDSEKIWNICTENLNLVAKNTVGFVSSELDENINKHTELSQSTYLYYLLGSESVSYRERLENLRLDLDKLKFINSNYKANDKKIFRLEKELVQNNYLLSEQERAINLLASDLDTSQQYTDSIKLRVYDVNDSLRKYKDLQRLESIGSKENFQLVKNRCPTCHMEIEDSLLSHIQSESTKILGLEDNIKYLEKQKEAFSALLKGEIESTKKKEVRLGIAKNKISETRAIIREIKTSLVDEKNTPSRSDIKKEIIIENDIESIETALRQEEELKARFENALKSWRLSDSALDALPKSGLSASDWKKLKVLKRNFVSNLEVFGYSSNDLSDFEISERSYKPTLNEVDINSEASASDNIRVIWAYLYSILTLDQNDIGSTNHLGLLIMDEPRQQEAKNESFGEFITKSAGVKNMGKQIIIGTSENYSELQKTIEDLDINIQHFDSDIIHKL
ncbi:hypothetical protein [Vreelandella sulfidaeris]|uniref:hypothetical protein n=1 Tax=Vreelandella sulfidaeris TaxID=115553 RepID=UPI0035EECC0D